MKFAPGTNEHISTAIRWFGEAMKLSISDAQILLQSKIKISTLDEDQVIRNL
jgi:hypothetical protein